jgi:RIO kinase 1
MDIGRFSDAEEDEPVEAEPAADRVPATDDGGASRDDGRAAGLPDDEFQPEDDDEDYGSDEGWDGEWDGLEGGGVGGARLTVAKSDSLASRFDSLISLEPLRRTGMSQTAGNSLKSTEKKFAQAKPTGLTRDERATTEHVLDPRTRLILFKMLNSGLLDQINGCVSTGKEANVYHATGRDGETAIKVYKTSVLTFKDRDRYVSGEFRWRHGYCRSNPRKMVRMWAEKEMRNYRRLSDAGVLCPTPLMLREHVLLMSFIGQDGYAAPRLKDAELTAEDVRSACRQVRMLLRAIIPCQPHPHQHPCKRRLLQRRAHPFHP